MILEQRGFKKAEKEVTRVVGIVNRAEMGSKIVEDNSCSRMHKKYSEGARKCSVVTYIEYKGLNTSESSELVNKLKTIIKNSANGAKEYGPAYVGDALDTEVYKYGDKECTVRQNYYKNQTIIYHKNPSYNYTGLLVTVSCSGSALWDYYPRSDKL